MTAFINTGVRVTDGDVSWRAGGTAASEEFFDVLGTGFVHGRGFSPSTGDFAHPAPELVLHYDTWRTRFGEDRDAIGRWIEISDHRFQIVGVAAPGFAGPAPVAPNLWVPAPWVDILRPGRDTMDSPDHCCIDVFARLKPDTTSERATEELAMLSAGYRETIGQPPARVLLTAPTMLANPSYHSRAAPVFLLAGAAALLILLLACANAANLQLARALGRRQEMAVRVSLGAGAGRVFRQLLTESLLIAALAAAASCALAHWLPRILMAFIVPESNRLTLHFGIDWRVLAAVAAVTAAAAALSGLAPALTLVRDGLARGLRESSRLTSSTWMRHALLATQVALCATLLTGSWLLLRALQRARAIDPGFAHAQVIRLTPHIDSSGASDQEAQVLLESLQERLAALPGVTSVSHTAVVPLGNSFHGTSYDNPSTGESTPVGVSHVSPNFFDTLQIPLVAGRSFEPQDETRTDVTIIDEELAQHFWPDETALGKRLGDRTVVGVVRSVRVRGLAAGGSPQTYLASRGAAGSEILIAHEGPAERLLAGISDAARAIDRRIFPTVAPYSATVEEARGQAATAASLASGLSLLALLLACFGIYGVAASMVSQRLREIGIRVALGARRSEVASMVIRQSLRTAAVGVILGIAGAVGFGKMLGAMLYGVEPTDPFALAATLATLTAVTVAAAWIPARRAARVDPTVMLRCE
jgi:predicted permease